MFNHKKIEIKQVRIFQYDRHEQRMSLVYQGKEPPKSFRRFKRIWSGIDKMQKIKTIIIGL